MFRNYIYISIQLLQIGWDSFYSKIVSRSEFYFVISTSIFSSVLFSVFILLYSPSFLSFRASCFRFWKCAKKTRKPSLWINLYVYTKENIFRALNCYLFLGLSEPCFRVFMEKWKWVSLYKDRVSAAAAAAAAERYAVAIAVIHN